MDRQLAQRAALKLLVHGADDQPHRRERASYKLLNAEDLVQSFGAMRSELLRLAREKSQTA